MFDAEKWTIEGQRTWEPKEDRGIETVDDVEFTRWSPISAFRLVFGLAVTVVFFMIPIPWDGGVEVVFSILYGYVIDNLATYASWTGVAVTGYAALATVGALVDSKTEFAVPERVRNVLGVEYWETTLTFGFLRVIGFVFLVILGFGFGPAMLHVEIAQQLFSDIVPVVVVVMPTGAIAVSLLTKLGGLDFVGTLGRPFMRPLFGLPGRSALDAVASVFASSIVGLYLTYNVFQSGGYSKRHVYIMSTCFLAVNVGSFIAISGFVGVTNLLPILLICWFALLIFMGVVFSRIPPISRVPRSYIEEPDIEPAFTGSVPEYLKFAVSNGLDKAKAHSATDATVSGFVEGVRLVGVVTGVAIAFMYPLFLLFGLTNVFEVVSSTLAPAIEIFGIPNAQTVSISLLMGLIAAIFTGIVAGGVGIDPMAGFFITLVAASHVIQLGSVVAIGSEMFQDAPLRIRDLLLVSIMRLMVLVPVVAAFTHAMNAIGVFG